MVLRVPYLILDVKDGVIFLGFDLWDVLGQRKSLYERHTVNTFCCNVLIVSFMSKSAVSEAKNAVGNNGPTDGMGEDKVKDPYIQVQRG